MLALTLLLLMKLPLSCAENFPGLSSYCTFENDHVWSLPEVRQWISDQLSTYIEDNLFFLSPLVLVADSHLSYRSQFTATVSEILSFTAPHYPVMLIKIPWCLQSFDWCLPAYFLWTLNSAGAGITLIRSKDSTALNHSKSLVNICQVNERKGLHFEHRLPRVLNSLWSSQSQFYLEIFIDFLQQTHKFIS